MSNVFVSYARDDSGTVAVVAQDLNDLGHQTWYDKVLRGGQDWWVQVLANIQHCDVFVLCVSPHSLRSEACLSELSFAIETNRHILPVVVAPVELATLPTSIGKRHVVSSYVDKDRRAAMVELQQAILALGPGAPLPNPLPGMPPVPGSYLMSLSDQVNTNRELSGPEQRTVVAELEAALAKGGEDAHHARGLLTTMRSRGDILYQTVQQIDEALKVTPGSSGDAPSGGHTGRAGPPLGGPSSGAAGGPGGGPHVGQPAGHPPAPQPNHLHSQGAPSVKKSSSNPGCLVAAIVVGVIALVGGCLAIAAGIEDQQGNCFVNDFGQLICP